MSAPIRLVEEARARVRTRMERRELTAHVLVGVPFMAGAVLLVAFGLHDPVDATDVTLFVLAAAIMGRLKFETGAGFLNPGQLIFVPMLFVLPAAVVPLVVVAGLVLDSLPEVLTGRLHPERLLLAAADAWYSIGPAIVFVIASVDTPEWQDWPIYVLALLAQFIFDFAGSAVRLWLAHGVAPRLQLDILREVWLIDALLAPVGLLAAFSSLSYHYAFLLVLPLAVLLAMFARERRGRFGDAIELSATYRGAARLLGDVISADDELTGSHSPGVVVLALAIADELGLGEEDQRLVEFAAMLCDIGKLETPREILHKPGPLTDEEWEAMREHTIAGQAMLDRVGGTLHDVGLVVRSSRERFAGDGYPDALAGQEIPLAARVVAVAAAYSAMTTPRPYRPALTHEQAIDELRCNGGTQFDPRVVAAACVVLAHGLPDADDAIAGTDLPR